MKKSHSSEIGCSDQADSSVTPEEMRLIFVRISDYLKNNADVALIDGEPFTLAAWGKAIGHAGGNWLTNYRNKPDRKTHLKPHAISSLASAVRIRAAEFTNRKWLDDNFNPTPDQLFLVDTIPETREVIGPLHEPIAPAGDAGPNFNDAEQDHINLYASDAAASGRGWKMLARPITEIKSRGAFFGCKPELALKVPAGLVEQMGDRINPNQYLVVVPELAPNIGSIVVIWFLDDEPNVWTAREYVNSNAALLTVNARDKDGKPIEEHYAISKVRWHTALQY